MNTVHMGLYNVYTAIQNATMGQACGWDGEENEWKKYMAGDSSFGFASWKTQM
jgi:hypothetical protein